MSFVTDSIYTRLSGFAGLTALISTRIYYGKVPQAPTYPLLVYNRISGARAASLSGHAGLGMPRFQIDVYTTDTARAAKEIADQVRYALDGYRQGTTTDQIAFGRVVDEQDSVDNTTGTLLHRCRLDVLIDHAEASS